MPGVRLVDVVKKYGRIVAVDHVTLSINDGEFFALLGPSGCGKTTTLRLIAGLEYPDEGSIYIGDRDVTRLHPRNRDVAMVFQNYALYPHMTVFENIAFPLEVRRRELGLTRDDIRRMVVETARFLGIDHLLDRRPGQLSGGQQQRVALARALVRKPKVWLLDEPLSNLDAKLRLLMRAELKRLQKTLGITTVYVTHDQAEAMTMADRIAVMDKGRVKQVGTPEDLYYRPANMFVAGFIGTPPVNFIKSSLKKLSEEVKAERGVGIVEASKTRYVLELPGLKVPVDPGIGSMLESKGVSEVVLAVRPQQVGVVFGDGAWDVEGEVLVVEPTGTESIVTVKLGDEVVRAVVPGDARVQMGSTVRLRFEWSKTLLFDPRTEELLA
ncbi:ABC transporter ATP-binding protein [Desulfurococcus mucosus]|uniref:Carbohydrate ABC transporter ATP-binding protein, CUT1 family n=1 Tax=Desulfurococcus mucosus (strain ATCC 35584 / DSM 2162 / JCM 9187 / O7/1) TaxID=765177 RepID=E8RA85_DESM0|nr:ABC transporter ATP-binding protein [Desulfurococcus mucosus]ADV65391.1 carbohydrate ABC transporter ATP-binding protein, CUT1 family [Desulfurococcus mucosus DSM 2162]